MIRTNDGRAETTSFCIVDAQSIQNADTAESKGYDAGKKISGIKRHIAVDTNGLPHALYVTTANVTDRAGAILMFESAKDNLSLVQNVLVDGGYTGETFANKVNEMFINRRLWLEVIGKGNKIGYIPVIPELAVALNEYRKFYDLPTLDKRTGNESHIPLIILHKKSSHYSPISPSHLWYLVKSTCILFTETIKDQAVIEKIRKVSPHWFRHSSATAQVDSGIDIRVVQQNLRHSSIETTMRYQHIDNDTRHQATINFGSRIKTVDK